MPVANLNDDVPTEARDALPEGYRLTRD